MSINISRFIDRETAEFTIEVLTPMFLGGADGNAELRAAPFKNALRYWWRVTQGNIPNETLLEKEQKLFGGVAGKANRSLVDVIVLGSVKTGKIGAEDFIGSKFNLEAYDPRTRRNGMNVSLVAYLGMGPVHFKGKYVKTRILPSERFTLSVSFPKENTEKIIDALSLFKEFGGLGARSRNGWGSLNLLPKNNTILLLPREKLFEKYGNDITSIFAADKKYPFRLGTTGGRPLLWKIGSEATWQNVMKEAGSKYMDLRQQALPFPKEAPKTVQKRHILGYPITNHIIGNWGGRNGRMPSQLRIIIRRKNNKYTVYFFHLPHKIPKQWDSRLGEELFVWKEIHKHLDKNFDRVI